MFFYIIGNCSVALGRTRLKSAENVCSDKYSLPATLLRRILLCSVLCSLTLFDVGYIIIIVKCNIFVYIPARCKEKRMDIHPLSRPRKNGEFQEDVFRFYVLRGVFLVQQRSDHIGLFQKKRKSHPICV